PRKRSDSEPVVEAVCIFKCSAGSVVETADDVRVQKSVSALRACLAGRIVLKSNTRGRQIRMSGDRCRIVDNFDNERTKLAAGESLVCEEVQIAWSGWNVS